MKKDAETGNVLKRNLKATLSVIIPAYNAKPYIDNCLRSVMSQQHACFEVILVNDGSTDHTSKICKNWAERYQNIIYIEQENQGQGSARNVAIEHSSGEWLVFLDADDEMLPGALEILDKNAAKETDILWYGHLSAAKNKKWVFAYLPYHAEEKEKILQSTSSVLWDKMFRAEFWKSEGICLSNRYGEDLYPVYMLMAKARTIRILSVPLLYHYIREDNLTSKRERILEIVPSAAEVLEAFRNKNLFDSHRSALFLMLALQHKYYSSPWNTGHPKENKQIAEELRRMAGEYFPEEYQRIFDFEKETVIIIGKIDETFPPIFGIWNSYYYGCMEQFLIEENNIEDKICHFIVNVESEIKSVKEQTRTLEWALLYWEMQCAELLDTKSKKNIKGGIFLYKSHESNRIISSFEDTAQRIWNCKQLNTLENIAEELSGWTEAQEELPAILDIPDLHFNYRWEFLRLEYNVNLLHAWLKLKQRGVRIDTYFLKHKYRKIAIYGLGYLGKLLADELRGSDISISYFIDRNIEQEAGQRILSPENTLPPADVIVVSVINQYEAIRRSLRCACYVVSLQEVIEECR